MKKSTDIRVIKTQKALLNALKELIQTKKLSCITITELCTKANINRNTFYYHYNNIYELLAEYKQLLMDEFTSVLDVNKNRTNRTVLDVCKIIYRHPNFMSIIISPNCDLDYFDEIFGVASEKARIMMDKKHEIKSTADHLACCYCNAGCIAVLREWVAEGMEESPESIAEIISLASRKGPISILFPEN